MIDAIVIGLIVLAAIFGLIRGIVSQVMAILGLVAAYFAAPVWGKPLAGLVQTQLGCSRFMAEKASIFLVGVAIYLAARLLGYGLEKLIVNRVKEFKKLNRLGGAFLGAVKMTALLAFIFFFIALLPIAVVRAWVPKLPDSHTYRLASDYNPMGRRQTLETMRTLRSKVQDPRKRLQLEKDPAVNELLSRHRLKGFLSDPKVVKRIEDGDYETLQKRDEVEGLMKDEQLVGLLEKLGESPEPQK